MPNEAGYIRDLGIEKIVLLLFDVANDTLTTATLTSGTNFMDYGILANATIARDSSVTEFKDITLKVRDRNVDFSTKITGAAMQTSKTLHDWAYTTANNYYIAYIYAGIKDAKHQEFFALVKDSGKFNITNPGGTTSNQFEFTIVNWDAAIALNATQFTTIRGAVTTYPISTAGVSIPANQASAVLETTVT